MSDSGPPDPEGFQLNPEAAERLVQTLREKNRLSKLTNYQLVLEALESSCSDYEVVLEMMDRLYPGWDEDVPD